MRPCWKSQCISYFVGETNNVNKDAEIDINDEDYATFAKRSLNVNIVSSRKLATELPPSGQGASFILNHIEKDKSYRGRVSKNDFNWKKAKKSKKNKGKGKTVLFLDECGIYI